MNHLRQVLRPLLVSAPIALVLAACGGGGSHHSGVANSPRASTFDSSVPTAWFDLLYANVKSTGTPPPAASRVYGYASLALYEAIRPGMPDHKTLQGQLVAFPVGTIPTPTNAVHHWPTVANRVLAVMAAHEFPAAQPAIDALETSIQTPFDASQDAAVITRSVQFGQDVADAVIAFEATDGFAGLAACTAAYVVPVTPVNGGWTGTGVGLQPCWGTLRTFAVTDADECTAIGAPPYSTSNTSAFYGQALVVYGTTGDAGASLTADQLAIANYWADGPTATGTPGGHWISIVRVLAEANALSLDVTTEAYARVGIAIHDAFIACWKVKYDDYLLRPITYIRANIDAGWDPLLTTPNFPTYTSGHSTQSGAAATVLTGQFGPLAFTDTTHTDLDPALGFTDRSFDNFLEAANEAAASRLYGGIHYPFDNQDGFNQGACIGEIINSRIEFRN
jgi:hypothetical protein